MSGNVSSGSRNRISVEATQPVTKNLFAGMTPVKEKFKKSESEIVTLKRCEVVETKKGTAMVCLEIAGKTIDPLFITPMKGVGHTVGSDRKFWKIEATNHIKRFSCDVDGKTIDVQKEDVIPMLDNLDFGKSVSVEMENGYIFEGKVCDINRTRRFQFFKIVEAIGDKLGLTVGLVEGEGGVHKAILRQGKEISSAEFNKLFQERGVGATIQCKFSKNNITGKSSLYDIQVPENRKV